MHALLNQVQVADAYVSSADVVLVASLVWSLRVAVQLIVAKELNLLLVLGFVALLYALWCFHGERKRGTAQSKN